MKKALLHRKQVDTIQKWMGKSKNLMAPYRRLQVNLDSSSMKPSYREKVLPDSPHSITSLLCTTNNVIPPMTWFKNSRKSITGISILYCAKPGLRFARNHTKLSKHDPSVTSDILLEINPHSAHVRLPSGVETTVKCARHSAQIY